MDEPNLTPSRLLNPASKLNWTPIVITIIIVLTMIGIAGFYFNNLNNQQESGKTVSATGTAQIEVMPDKAVVYLLIQTKDYSAETAKNLNANISLEVTEALTKIGIKKTDIETENYNIYPEYNWINNEQNFIGYVASNNLKISSEDFNNVGKIVDAAVDAGATISYINFDLSTEKQNEYKKLVLANASSDAKEKAAAIASGLDMELDEVVSVSSSDYNYYPRAYYSAAMESSVSVQKAATDISPQNLDVSGTVTVTYSIK